MFLKLGVNLHPDSIFGSSAATFLDLKLEVTGLPVPLLLRAQVPVTLHLVFGIACFDFTESHCIRDIFLFTFKCNAGKKRL